MTGLQVGTDFTEGFLLGIREGEGQARKAGVKPGIFDAENTAGDRLPIAALAQNACLEEEDLIEGQTLAGSLQLGVGIGEMGLEQGGPQIGETSGSADGLGQVIGQLGGPVGDHLVHQLSEPFLGNVGG